VLFKSVNHIEELLSDVSLFSTGSHTFHLEGILSVIISLGIPLGGFGIDVFGQLSEFLHGLSVEQMGIGL